MDDRNRNYNTEYNTVMTYIKNDKHKIYQLYSSVQFYYKENSLIV